jgi:hypothetical protein
MESGPRRSINKGRRPYSQEAAGACILAIKPQQKNKLAMPMPENTSKIACQAPNRAISFAIKQIRLAY